ncbi:InlB B-repeat-containing protein, partial [Ruminococcaceae bacterium OttesenSCG-928-O06]|nr:InlB B-repeat-containing protein [Ruminococcaceae bacterium OttesenSCG-928-O06]
VYYEVDEKQKLDYTVEYYRDGDVYLDKTAGSVLVANPYVAYDSVSKTAFLPVGYKLEKVEFVDAAFASGSVKITATDNVIKVYYEVDEKQKLDYTVEYYYGGNIDDGKTEELSVLVARPEVESVPDKPMRGYTKNETTSTELPFTVTKTDNVIKVQYDANDPVTLMYHANGGQFQNHLGQTYPVTLLSGQTLFDKGFEKTEDAVHPDFEWIPAEWFFADSAAEVDITSTPLDVDTFITLDMADEDGRVHVWAMWQGEVKPNTITFRAAAGDDGVTNLPNDGEAISVMSGTVTGKYAHGFPTREGYVFSDWVLVKNDLFSESNIDSDTGVFFMPRANLVFEAEWEPAGEDAITADLFHSFFYNGVEQAHEIPELDVPVPVKELTNMALYQDSTLRTEHPYTLSYPIEVRWEAQPVNLTLVASGYAVAELNYLKDDDGNAPSLEFLGKVLKNQTATTAGIAGEMQEQIGNWLKAIQTALKDEEQTDTVFVASMYIEFDDVENAAFDGPFDYNTKVPGDATVYVDFALMDENQVLLTLHANDGSFDSGSSVRTHELPVGTSYRQLVKDDDAVVETPTREGYKFIGWSLRADGSAGLYTSAQVADMTLTESITFYAQWKAPLTITVKYFAFGEDSKVENAFPDTYDYGTSLADVSGNFEASVREDIRIPKQNFRDATYLAVAEDGSPDFETALPTEFTENTTIWYYVRQDLARIAAAPAAEVPEVETELCTVCELDPCECIEEVPQVETEPCAICEADPCECIVDETTETTEIVETTETTEIVETTENIELTAARIFGVPMVMAADYRASTHTGDENSILLFAGDTFTFEVGYAYEVYYRYDYNYTPPTEYSYTVIYYVDDLANEVGRTGGSVAMNTNANINAGLHHPGGDYTAAVLDTTYITSNGQVIRVLYTAPVVPPPVPEVVTYVVNYYTDAVDPDNQVGTGGGTVDAIGDTAAFDLNAFQPD